MPATIRLAGRRVAAVLAAVGLAAAACTDSDPTAQPTTAPSSSITRPAQPAPPDQNLRDVTKAMLYSDGIAYTLPETAAQMICGALTPNEWSDVLGSTVGRTVFGGVDASCVIDTGILSVQLKMVIDYVGTNAERINGRAVKVDPSPFKERAYASAAVVSVGELQTQEQQRFGAEPVLRLSAKMAALHDATQDLNAMVRRLISLLVPRLAPADKPPTPLPDARGILTYIPTEPVAGVKIHDLPRPVQSHVLCTAVLRVTGIKLSQTAAKVNSVGECYIPRLQISAEVDPFEPPIGESSPYKVAGRPAFEQLGTGILINLLTAQSEYSRPASVTLRLERTLPSSELRTWAEKVANALLVG